MTKNKKKYNEHDLGLVELNREWIAYQKAFRKLLPEIAAEINKLMEEFYKNKRKN